MRFYCICQDIIKDDTISEAGTIKDSDSGDERDDAIPVIMITH